VPKRGVAPFGFPHHFRFSDTKPTLPVLHPHPGNQKSTVAIFKGDVDRASLFLSKSCFLAILRKRGLWCGIFN
jgi:hypothetical protein